MPLETINLAVPGPGREGNSKNNDNNSNTASNGKGSGFQATPEELDAIREKIKDPVFAKLMHEYMESLSDPETLREEEAYLEQAEREAREGGDFSFEFIFPRPGFAVELLNPATKTISASDIKKMLPMSSGVATSLKDVRTFVNMCSSEKIPIYREEPTGDRMGSNWHIPVSVSQKRIESFSSATKGKKEADGKSSKGENSKAENDNNAWCYVYDAVFHPQTLSLADRSNRFLCFLVEIAVEHINAGNQESNGFEFTRLSSSVATVVGTLKNQTIRTKDKNGASSFEVDRKAPVLTRPTAQLVPTEGANSGTKPPLSSAAGAPLLEQRSEARLQGRPDPLTEAKKTSSQCKAAADSPGFLPPHRILHRGRLDLTDAWAWKVVDKRVGVPEELVVKLTFEGVQQAAGLDLSITEDGSAVRIEKTPTQTQYEGLLVLPFTVKTAPVSARFDRTTHVLSLVLSVIPPALSEESVAVAEAVKQRYLAMKKEPDAAASLGTDGEVDAVGVSAGEKTTEGAVEAPSTATKEVGKPPHGNSDDPQSIGPFLGAAVAALESTPVNTTAATAVEGAAGPEVVACKGSVATENKDSSVAKDDIITEIEPAPAESGFSPQPLLHSTVVDPVRELVTTPEKQSNAFQHFDSSSRAQVVLEKIMEARRAREAAANSAAEEHKSAGEESAAQVMDTVQVEGTEIKQQLSESPLPDSGTQHAVSTAPEGEAGSISGVDSVPEEGETAALVTQQDTWLRKLQEEVAAAAAKEDEEAEEAALKVQRDAQRSKRRLEKLVKLEEMEKQMLQKVKAIPLTNRYIFSID